MKNKIAALSRRIPYNFLAQRVAFILTVVCCVVCGGIALYMLVQRFGHLSNSLQYDELYSAITASPKFSFSYVWHEMLLKDVNLPLFNVLLSMWNRIFPYTVFWMHLFSALLSTAAVVVAWLLAPKYWDFLKKWIFVTLMSGSFVLVWYGSVIRSYSLSVFCTTVFTLLALRLIHQFSEHQAPSKRSWLFFFGVGLVGAYSHYFCSGVFFITALVVFLYACYYKQSRAWAFWGTAVVFALWSVWLVSMYSVITQPADTWWMNKKEIMKATWEVLSFLLGLRKIFTGILFGCVVAAVSLVSTYRKSLLKQADIVLPLAQIVLLCAVVAVVSCKYNLWLDRYFLAVMPCVLLLFAGFLYHLYERHTILLVLWPVLLMAWAHLWLNNCIKTAEYTGLPSAIKNLTDVQKVDKVFVDITHFDYPVAARVAMLEYYVPEGKKLEIIPLTKANAHEAYESTPKIPVLMPICSQLRLITSTIEKGVEEDGSSLLEFNPNDRAVCVYTVHAFSSGQVS